MKKWWGLGLVGVIIVLSLGAAMYFTNQGKSETAAAKKTSEVAKAGLVTAKAPEVLALFEQKASGLVYIGRPTCEKCQAFQPKLEAALTKNKQGILYYNTDDGKKADLKKFEKVIEETEITAVPAVLAIKDGKVVKRLENFKESAKITAFLAENR